MYSTKIQVNNTLYVDRATNSVGINTALPLYNLDVLGSMNITSSITIGGSLFCSCNLTVNGSPVVTSGGSGGSGINLGTTVGVGCNTPRYPLDVNGSANFGGDVYVGSNSSNNVIRFCGTYGDGSYTTINYDHTVIGERIYVSGTEKSELLLFKGNDIPSIVEGPDRVRILSTGGFKVDISTWQQGWNMGGSPPATTIEAMTINNNGYVGINCNSPRYQLDVNGILKQTGDTMTFLEEHTQVKESIAIITNGFVGSATFWLYGSNTGGTNPLLSNTLYLYHYGGTPNVKQIFRIHEYDTNNTLYYTGNISAHDIFAFSDQRLKENIITIDKPMEKIMQMRGVYFNKKDDASKTRNVGVIAQEVESIFPEVIHTSIESEHYKTVAYGNMTALLVEGMKAQQSTIHSLQTTLSTLMST
jgi:hypothetical protein